MGVLKKITALGTAAALSAGMMMLVPVSAEDISNYTASDIVKEMGVGWNLGNTLDAHDGDNHKKLGLESETYWGNPKTTKAMIDAVKDKGFNTIRVPVTWYEHTDDNYTIDAQWMSRVREVVDWCIQDDMYVILNIHHEEWNRPTDANYSAASWELKTLWTQIAGEFKDYDKHLVFEGMNEPRNYNGANEWTGGTDEMRRVVNQLNADFVNTVRSTGGKNSDRALMIPTYAASVDSAALRAWTSPNNDPNVIASIHAYSPYSFAMNGHTQFDDTMERELTGLFTSVNSVFVSKNIPVCIGEFSASNYDNSAERVKWAASYAEKAAKAGIPIVLWDNNIPKDNGGEAHGYFDRKNLSWYQASEGVVNKLIETYNANKAARPSSSDKAVKSNIFSGNLSASGYNASSAVAFDPSVMSQNGFIAVTYSQDVPVLVVQDDNPWKVWAKVMPCEIKDGVAYYSYDDTVSSYAADFSANYGRNPSSPLENAFQLFVTGNSASDKISVSRIDYAEGSTTPSNPEPTPTDPEPAPTDPEPTPTDPEPAPTDPEPAPTDPEPTPSDPEPAPTDPEPTPTDPQKPVINKSVKGDVNVDGQVNVTDAALSSAHVKGLRALEGQGLINADVNEDNKVNVTDSALIAAHVKGLRSLA